MSTKASDTRMKKPLKGSQANGSPAKRVQMKHVRWFVLAAVFVVICVGLVLNTNLGTLSSFGWQAIAAICPLGALESMLASRSIFLRALVVLAVVVAAVVVFGKFFCAWVCPVAPIRSLKTLVRKRFKRGGSRKEPAAAGTDLPGSQEAPAASATPSAGVAGTAAPNALERGVPACGAECASCASSCAAKRPKIDSRHLVLGGSLLSAALFGFPVFCLLCPIGLIFGTVIVAWQFVGADDLSLSLLIYPVLLVVELLVLRKWCGRFCPMGAMLSLISLSNRFFKPVVDRKKCIRARGGSCTVCSDVCPEALDPHCSAGMNECTKCGLCRDVCPTGAIGFAPFPKRGSYDDIPLKSPQGQEAEDPQPLPQ